MPIIPAWKQIKERERFPLNSHKLSLALLFFASPRHQMPFFQCFLHPTFIFSAPKPCLHLVPVCLSQLRCRDGAQPQPRGAEEEGNPQDNWSGHGHPKTSNHPYSTLYVPGKHLLCSLAEMLASILPPHSCLVMPIRVHTALCSGDGEERR